MVPKIWFVRILSLCVGLLVTFSVHSYVFASDTITLTIRSGATTAFSGSVNLPDVGSSNVLITPTNSATAVSVSARSLLAVLTALDGTSNNFDITNLAHFPSFSPPSFIINCIAIPSGASPDCYDWTYAVNGTYPWDSIDNKILQSGDVVYLFFGPSHHVVLSKNSVAPNEQFMATAEQYELSSGNYIPLPGVTIGVGTSNPDWTFTTLSSKPVDAGGQAQFSVSSLGTYSVGIAEDSHFPATTLTISTNPAPTPSNSTSIVRIFHRYLDIPKAQQFLISKQKADGSFGPAMYTDWAAIALASTTATSTREALIKFLSKPDASLDLTTDYERRAMALMAMGVNPYNGTPVNYIKKITDTFDGTQIGDTGLVNDDIFALFPLLKAGYSLDDNVVKKTIDHIILKQKSSGSWENSPDLTAAAIQALSLASTSDPEIKNAISEGRRFLTFAQQGDAGFGSSYSTSWAMQAISAMGEPMKKWMRGSADIEDSLATTQQGDGGLESPTTNESSRIWATAYAVPAALHKPWGEILTSFDKPVIITEIKVPDATSTSTASLLLSTTSAPVVTIDKPAVKGAEIIKKPAPQPVEIKKQTTKPVTKRPAARKNITDNTDRNLSLSALAILSGILILLIVL